MSVRIITVQVINYRYVIRIAISNFCSGETKQNEIKRDERKIEIEKERGTERERVTKRDRQTE